MKRIFTVFVVMAVMAAMVAAMAVPAFAAPRSANGTCEVGGEGGGAQGCAGNIGGTITPQKGKNAGQCRQINQGPFNEYSCETAPPE